jgi:uncharacterized protein with HEPN domain
MPRDFRLYLEDIASSAGKILSYVGDMPYEEFIRDDMRVDAVIRNFEIIGIAARNVPDAVRAEHPGLDWKRISDFRNILAHEYFGVDFEIMWDIIKNKLPGLVQGVRAILQKEE